MTALQKINKEKKRNEEAQNKVQAEFNRAKRKSTDSQEEVDHLNKKLNSAQKAKQTLTSGRMQIAELNAADNASGKKWMTGDVIQAGDKVLKHINDLKEEAIIDNTKAKEYKTEVMKAKLVMGKSLWEFMLITMKADKNKQPDNLQKNDLNIKYLWE